MTMTGEDRSTLNKTFPSATLSTTNSALTGVGQNRTLRTFLRETNLRTQELNCYAYPEHFLVSLTFTICSTGSNYGRRHAVTSLLT